MHSIICDFHENNPSTTEYPGINKQLKVDAVNVLVSARVLVGLGR